MADVESVLPVTRDVNVPNLNPNAVAPPSTPGVPPSHPNDGAPVPAAEQPPKDPGNPSAASPAEQSTSPESEEERDKTGADFPGGFASIGSELYDNAPIWRVFRDEVRSHDQNVTLDEWNKTLDVLLIFAGLFSAVVTTLVVATFPLLNPQEDYVATALYTLARSLDKDTTLSAPTPVGPAETSSLWINGLWFASLFVSLAVAFFAILAKQWLVEYNHRMADPPADPTGDAAVARTASLIWAHRRGFFFEGFDKWHVPALITQVLPLLLHIALFLFFVGLTVFVWTLNRPIARGMIALTALVFSLYILSTVLPVWYLDCPTATPLIRQVREIPVWLTLIVVEVSVWLTLKVVEVRASISHMRGEERGAQLPSPPGEAPVSSLRVARVIDDLRNRLDNIRSASWDDKGQSRDSVTRRTLRWLIVVSGSESAISIVFQSLGALDLDQDSAFICNLQKITSGMSAFAGLQVAPTALEVVRAIRSELVLGRGMWTSPMLGLDLTSPMINVLEASYWPDARLLWASMKHDDLRAGHMSPSSSTPDICWVPEYVPLLRALVISSFRARMPKSLHMTARLLLRSEACPHGAAPYLMTLVSTRTSLTKDDHRHVIRMHDDSTSQSRYLANGGELSPVSSSSGFHLPNSQWLGWEERLTCDCAHIASIICNGLTFSDHTDYQIGAWALWHVVQNCRCGRDRTETIWRTLKQIVSGLQSEFRGCNFEEFGGVYEGLGWVYRATLFLALLSFGSTAARGVEHMNSSNLDEILPHVLDLDLQDVEQATPLEQHRSGSEVCTLFLVQVMTSPHWRPGVAELQQMLAGACTLQRRQRVNPAVKAIVESRVDILLMSLSTSEFMASTEYLHFLQHLAELDSGWQQRLDLLRNSGDDEDLLRIRELVAQLKQSGPCSSCPGVPPTWDPLYLDASNDPNRGRVSPSGTSLSSSPIPTGNPAEFRSLLPIVQMLLDEEMEYSDQEQKIRPEIWSNLLRATEVIVPPYTLQRDMHARLLVGVCGLHCKGWLDLGSLINKLIISVRTDIWETVRNLAYEAVGSGVRASMSRWTELRERAIAELNAAYTRLTPGHVDNMSDVPEGNLLVRTVLGTIPPTQTDFRGSDLDDVAQKIVTAVRRRSVPERSITPVPKRAGYQLNSPVVSSLAAAIDPPSDHARISTPAAAGVHSLRRARSTLAFGERDNWVPSTSALRDEPRVVAHGE